MLNGIKLCCWVESMGEIWVWEMRTEDNWRRRKRVGVIWKKNRIILNFCWTNTHSSDTEIFVYIKEQLESWCRSTISNLYCLRISIYYQILFYTIIFRLRCSVPHICTLKCKFFLNSRCVTKLYRLVCSSCGAHLCALNAITKHHISNRFELLGNLSNKIEKSSFPTNEIGFTRSTLFLPLTKLKSVE